MCDWEVEITNKDSPLRKFRDCLSPAKFLVDCDWSRNKKYCTRHTNKIRNNKSVDKYTIIALNQKEEDDGS